MPVYIHPSIFYTLPVYIKCLFQPLCSSFFHPQKCKNTQNCSNRQSYCAQQVLSKKRAAKLYYSSPSHFSGVLKNECVFKCRALACRRAWPSCDVWVWKQEKVQPQSSRAEKHRLLQGFLLIWTRMEERNGEMGSTVLVSDGYSMGHKMHWSFLHWGVLVILI